MDELQYILQHGRSLMTEDEQAATTLAVLRQKRLFQERGEPGQFYAEQQALAGDLGRLPIEALHEHLLQRFRRDHASSGFFAYCPACRALLRTPRARQCAGCGADWHEASSIG